MGIQIQPEPDNQNPETQTPPDEQVTTQDTQNQEPQNNPPAPSINPDEIHGLYRGVLHDYSQRAARLEQELERVRNERQQPQNQPTPEQDVELLTTNPRELIRQEFQASIAPLNQQVQEFQRANQITLYKQRMQANPMYSQFMGNDKFIPYFDNVLGQVAQLNDNSVYAAYLAAVGLFVQSPEYQQSLTQTQTPNQPITQPTHHRQTVPTPPANNPAPPRVVPQNNNRGPKKTYTANEKLLMQMRGMTEEEWEAELALSPSQVVNGPQSNG